MKLLMAHRGRPGGEEAEPLHVEGHGLERDPEAG